MGAAGEDDGCGIPHGRYKIVTRADQRVLKLIRVFLNAVAMEDGLVCREDEATP